MTLDDDEARQLFEQFRSEQTNAGIGHIAAVVGDFRDALIARGFKPRQAFELCREFLVELMGRLEHDD